MLVKYKKSISKMNPIFTAISLFVLIVGISCDTCDTYVHPQYGQGVVSFKRISTLLNKAFN